LEWVATGEDVAAFQLAMRSAFLVAGPKSVICADWRKADVFPPAVGDALIALLKAGNRRFQRSAILLPPTHATFNLQVERLLREAQNPERQAFRAPMPMLAWIGTMLSEDESRRAREFLGVEPE
jgi:hypothetical protein